MSGSVDDIWNQLKKSQAPRRSGPSLSGFAGLPGVISHVRTYDKNGGSAEPAAKPSFIAQLTTKEHLQDGESQRNEHQALLASLQRDINGLSSPDRSSRRQAVEKLHVTLFGGEGAVAPEALQAVVTGGLLVPVVRLLADPAEKCRELTITLLKAALEQLPQPEPLLSTLVPAVAERIGSLPPQEESEELRLALAEMVAGPLLARAPQPLPDALVQPLCASIACELQDAYSDIKKAACVAVGKLASLASASSLPTHVLEALLLTLLPNLAHQHSKVRLASLQALHSLVQHGMPLTMMEEHVLPAVRPLAQDHVPAIRAALFSSAAEWAGSQSPRDADSEAGNSRTANQCRSFMPLLLPLLLLGLTDEAEPIRSNSYAHLEAIGASMERWAHAGQSSSGRNSPNFMALDLQQLPGYCHPFSQARPSAPTRFMVQSHLSQLLQQAVAELREWTATLRVLGARLLRASIIYGEDQVVPYLPKVLAALHDAVADDDSSVAAHAVGSVHILGVNLMPRHWMPFAAEAVIAEPQSAIQRTAALVVLAALLHAAGKTGVEADLESLQLGVGALCTAQQTAHGCSAAEGAAMQQQLLAGCSNLLLWSGPAATSIAPQLFQVLLQLWDVQQNSQAALPGSTSPKLDTASGTAPEAVLGKLSTAMGKSSPAELCEQFGLRILQSCIQGHDQWTHKHRDWCTLSALLRLSNCAALLQLWPRVLPALSLIASSHKRDPLLRLELFQLIVLLLEDDSKADAWQQASIGLSLASRVLMPGLVWRAGRVAAAVRFADLTALAALLSKQRLSQDQLAELATESGTGEAAVEAKKAGETMLTRITGCLDEDYEPDTRQLACRVLELLLGLVGQRLPEPQLAAIQPELLKRLDDSSNSVRIAACTTMGAWLQSILAAKSCLKDADASSLAGSLLIHASDPDAAVAEAACKVLEALATARPGNVKPFLNSASMQHLRVGIQARLLAACGE